MLVNVLSVAPFALLLVVFGLVVQMVLFCCGLLIRRIRRRLEARRTWPVRVWLAPWLFGSAGMLWLIVVAWGSWFGSASVRVTRSVVTIAGMPAEFDGLRIVQLSDLHAASLERQGAGLWTAVADRANALRPDVLVVTGDYGTPAEMASAPALLERIHARLGKFAVLGNHDYGDKERAEDNWASPADKRALEHALREAYRARGVTLLLNEAVDVAIGRARLTLAGVAVYDPHHGFDDARRLPGGVTILLAHSPEYWEAAVRGRWPVPLTLTGHTHGAQVAIGSGDRAWSPASLQFARWRGLHDAGGQHLHVSTGVGVYGFPVRLNMPPEVALIELRRN